MNKIFFIFATLLIWCLCSPVLAMDSDKEGARLYIYHSCNACHGTEGRTPMKEGIPSLAGKPANRLFDTAWAILNGKGSSKKSQTMHEAFSQCDEPPTREELRQITGWLSAL